MVTLLRYIQNIKKLISVQNAGRPEIIFRKSVKWSAETFMVPKFTDND